MTRDEIIEMLTAVHPAREIGCWLRDEYIPEIIRRFNGADSRRRFGLYQCERIPENERNLTDVRTRMGVLIEFELARISNDLLQEYGITELFWSYVVANRFPDLEIRRPTGERLLRIEVKCLQSIAEEKSANFDTLLKDINPFTDFVVAFIWEWDETGGGRFLWDRSPKIYGAYTFHAYSLAKMRDIYWLNNPHNHLGDGYQGFDLRYAVNCEKGTYAKEEGNNGKLLRIWKQDSPYRPETTQEFLDTEIEYLAFVDAAFAFGFEKIAKAQLSRLTTEPIYPVVEDGTTIGYYAGDYAVISAKAVNKEPQKKWYLQKLGSRFLLTMNDKYKTGCYCFSGAQVVSCFSNVKPKAVYEQLINLV